MSTREDFFDDMYRTIAFGIDIGTSTCMMAYKEAASIPPKIPGYRGGLANGIPSLVMRDKSGREWVGDQVVDRQGLAEDPAGVCASVKMRLAEEAITLNGHSYTPRELATLLVNRVLEISRDTLEQEMIELKFRSLVCGVPVRFNAAQRGEMKQILQTVVGQDVEIRLVPEPILAALTNDFYSKRGKQTSRRVLVLDIGGGTTDAVMLMPNPAPTAKDPYPYIAKAPDGFLEAGDSMDTVMEDLILEKIKANPGGIKLQILNDPNHYDRRRLRQTAKEAKERLSTVDSCAVAVNGLRCGSTVVQVMRSEYEERIAPIIQRTVDLAERVLENCGLEKNPDIDILLVGGATHTPLLRRMLEGKFPWLKKEQILQRFPERAVAMGAAIYAEMPELVLPPVAYGYAVDTYIDGGKEKRLHVVIPPGAKLPATLENGYQTLNANQHAASFTVYEVSRGGAGEFLLMEEGEATPYKYTHEFNQLVPKGTPLALTTTLTQDGILKIRSVDYQSPRNTYEQEFTLNNTRSQ